MRPTQALAHLPSRAMTRNRPVPVLILGTTSAILLALLLAWIWHSQASSIDWNLAERVRTEGNRGNLFLGEAGGRAPVASQRFQDAYTETMALAWAMFGLGLVGHGAIRVACHEPIIGSQSWGLIGTASFMVALTLTWAAVMFT